MGERIGKLLVAVTCHRLPLFGLQVRRRVGGQHSWDSIGNGRSERNSNFRSVQTVGVGGERLKGPLDEDGDDGNVRGRREEPDAALGAPQLPGKLPSAFRKDRDRVSLLEPPDRFPNGAKVPLTPLERNDMHRTEVGPQERLLKQVGARHEAQSPPAGGRKERRIQITQMIGGEDEGAVPWHVLPAADLESEAEAEEQPQDELAEVIAPVLHGRRVRRMVRSISCTTPCTVFFVVSIRTASDGLISGPTLRLRSSPSRSSICSRIMASGVCEP